MTPEFDCRNCGVCCSQIPLIVAGDIREIIKHVKIPPEAFVQFYEPDEFIDEFAPDDQWLEMEDGLRVIAMKRVHDTCVFRDNGKCLIYAHRPLMCAMHPYQPRDVNEDDVEFNLECHHGCRGIPTGPASPKALKALRDRFDRFCKREWDYDDLVKKWNRKGRKRKSEEDFMRFIGVID
ncbi:MAG: YkgJ family cysteine cluster protein [Candidatus Eisenbacteria sp.]|nr:YkgJ family cysteine cluster protein [Candidatus Eisenbacteria bacterium]